jgi:uncharacterized protein
MADPAPTTGDTPDRRDRRRDRKRRKVRRVVGIVAAVLAIAAAALLAADVVRLGGGEPSLAGTVRASGNDDESPAATTTTGARNCRPLSSTEPLRLWVGGDSLAGSLGPELGKLAGATGVVQPYFDSRVSSGLSSPEFFDWPEHATTEMARLNPEIVVFIMGTNDWTAVSGDWKEKYSATVDSTMKTLIGPGRAVYWLGAPTLKDEEQDDAVVEVNAVAQQVAQRHSKVHYVDTYKLFSDPDGADGAFAYDLPDENGTTITMRAGDGVHFSMDGADYLARQVYKLVDAQCGVTEQKVDGETKQAIETEGSTQVAPGVTSGSDNTSGSGSSGNNSGTIQTRPPATAAPSTSPPVETAPPTDPPTVPTQPPDTTVPPTNAAP